jgi:phosphohistidine phosphatase SixA
VPPRGLRLEPELYAASSAKLLERIRIVPEEIAAVMLIGHNPGLQDLVLALASAGAELERLKAKFPTATLANSHPSEDNVEATLPGRRGACRVRHTEAARLSPPDD